MKRTSFLLASSLTAMLALSACSTEPQTGKENASLGEAAIQSMKEANDQKLVEMLDAQWEEGVAESPEYLTFLGRKERNDEWDDRSREAADESRAMTERHLAAVKEEFDRDMLTREGQLNYDLAIYTYENSLRLDDYRAQSFPLTQFSGIHSSIPVFLANFHQVGSVEDAEAYIKRVIAAPTPLHQSADLMEQRLEDGYPLPAFSYPLIEESARNVMDGKAVKADFARKVDALEIEDDAKADLKARLDTALTEHYQPGYAEFADRVAAMSKHPTVDGDWGIGRRNNGDNYYNALLASYTTTDLTADEIHEIGLAEVARIHEEMRGIMETVGFDGDLQAFFAFMRTDPQFYYENTDEGREAYLELARSYVDGMEPRLDELFITKPKAPVIVKRVEPYRERAAGKAFYNQPAPDGSRPGIFYANLAEMADMPTYQLEALVYHEAIPGHHMQRSIQIEMQGLPKFRQFGGYTAYTEGWGLYSELLPKEIGFYEDPYSDFGRLAMELWRAARLVVDTGLHAKGWAMDDAIAYLQENTPNPEGDTVKAIERYIVLPGQATAYKIGMLKILELREKAKTELGDKYNIAEFHEVVLTRGPLPLEVLETQVNNYIAATKGE